MTEGKNASRWRVNAPSTHKTLHDWTTRPSQAQGRISEPAAVW